MINHVRTLLLNVSGNQPVPDWVVGERLVPTTYRAAKLSTELQQVRNILFGLSPDRSMLNYRLAQFLPFLHQPGLEEYTLGPDSRITYATKPFDNSLFADSAFIPRADGLAITSVSDEIVPDPDITGQLYYGLRITRTGSGTVTLDQTSPWARSTVVTVSFTGGVSVLPIDLGGSGYECHVPDTYVGQAWNFAVTNRPVYTIADLLTDLSSIGEPVIISLFGSTNVEPYASFKNLYMTHPEPGYRLGGLLLALAWRTQGT